MLHHFKNWKKMVFIFIFICFTFSLLFSFFIWITTLDISDLEKPLPDPTYILDQNNEIVAQLSSSNVTPISLKEIPIQLREAIIAVEDKRFYDHHGVDVKAIFRAFIQNIKAGEVVEGGSTITQQLVKNIYFSSEQTLTRKLKEAAMAIKVDFVYSKEDILELYLNKIYFGEGRWGVQGAANVYFSKNAQALSLAESALLAGLPKAPTHYSPIKDKDKAISRRNLVLSLMLDQEYISEKEYNEAKSESVRLTKIEKDRKDKFASYVDYVIEEAVSKYGFTEEHILTSGLHIYTNLHPHIQKTMEKVYNDDSFFPESSDDQLIQSGAIVIDPSTGGILGLMGHRGEHFFRGFNRATQLKRQPGSSFKPLIVYAPALEKGYTPFSKLYDGKLNINGYKPQDWDGRTRGEVTLYEAIIKSWNIPAVWLLNEIGITVALNFVEKMGISLPEEDQNLGIALGGLSEGVSPLQMAQAFSAFPNLGTIHEAHAITKITTKDQHTLVEAKPMETNVMSPSTANVMTMMLKDAVALGTGRNASLNRPVAGKTGTTQLPNTKEFAGIDGNKDAWFVGYTPELVASVWMGYDQTDRHHYLNISGGQSPAIIFREIVSQSLKDVPVTPFKRP